jgi:Large ribosomal RNA subunit accumulation protein YceD
VVTLDPIESEIDEPFNLVFEPLPEQSEGDVRAVKHIDDADPPEPLQDGKIDLGIVAIEHLILGIDPYPRKPGAVFEAPPAGEPPTNPFAALAALKKDKGQSDPG